MGNSRNFVTGMCSWNIRPHPLFIKFEKQKYIHIHIMLGEIITHLMGLIGKLTVVLISIGSGVMSSVQVFLQAAD